MKQHTQVLGVRDWYGEDLLELQSEALDVIQGYFGMFGPFILQGCEISANGSNWDISAGLACIQHADGWKIVRVEAVVNTALPGYFTVGKETVNGDYGTGTDVAAYRYHADNAQWTAGSTTAADTKLIIPDPDVALPTRISEAIKGLTVSATQTFVLTLVTGEVKIAVNKAARLLYISGDLSVSFPSNAFTHSGVTILAESVIEANAVLENYIPTVVKYWWAHTPFQLGYIEQDSLPVAYEPGTGIVIYGPQNTGAFDVNFNAVIPLDV